MLPLPAAEAQQLNLPALSNGCQPPPTRCGEQYNRAGQHDARLFLAIPPYYPDEVRARLWAQTYGGGTMAPRWFCPVSVVQRARENAPKPGKQLDG